MSGTYNVVMGDRGRLVIPADLRERAGLAEGTALVLLETPTGLVLLTRPQLQELVRIAGIAVDAAEFAAAVRIDGPLERHALGSAVQEAARGKLEVLDGAFGGETFT